VDDEVPTIRIGRTPAQDKGAVKSPVRRPSPWDLEPGEEEFVDPLARPTKELLASRQRDRAAQRAAAPPTVSRSSADLARSVGKPVDNVAYAGVAKPIEGRFEPTPTSKIKIAPEPEDKDAKAKTKPSAMADALLEAPTVMDVRRELAREQRRVWISVGGAALAGLVVVGVMVWLWNKAAVSNPAASTSVGAAVATRPAQSVSPETASSSASLTPTRAVEGVDRTSVGEPAASPPAVSPGTSSASEIVSRVGSIEHVNRNVIGQGAAGGDASVSGVDKREGAGTATATTKLPAMGHAGKVPIPVVERTARPAGSSEVEDAHGRSDGFVRW